MWKIYKRFVSVFSSMCGSDHYACFLLFVFLVFIFFHFDQQPTKNNTQKRIYVNIYFEIEIGACACCYRNPILALVSKQKPETQKYEKSLN